MTSASRCGSVGPRTSTPTWSNCRKRPFCARSYRKLGPAYQALYGSVGRCSENPRTTDAVCSGRSARVRPPLSSKEYISLRTTSVASPRRWNTSTCSNIGGMTSRYPAEPTTSAKTSTRARHRAESGQRMSRVPFGARKTWSDTVMEATGAPTGTRRCGRLSGSASAPVSGQISGHVSGTVGVVDQIGRTLHGTVHVVDRIDASQHP